MSVSYLSDAKRTLTIYRLWQHLGYRGRPRKSCRCPWREDVKASFSVTTDGKGWNDFATGECGDAVAFLQRACGFSQREACRKFLELARGRFGSLRCPEQKQNPKLQKTKPSFPEFRKGKAADLRHLAALRNVSIEAVSLAQARGLLWFATVKGYDAWIVTDSERLNAQARRMDGRYWEDIQAKAWTLPGSWAAWPIGIKEAQPFPAIALCEGGPDLLAACHFITCEAREADCAPVALFGAAQRIHADALPLFAGKAVRIFGHADEEGRAGVVRWANQLEAVGAGVDAFDFNKLRDNEEIPVKDLNDCTSICADDFEANRDLWRMLP
jgi:hypothetical protein